MFGANGLALDTVVHIIQVSLTPVFLLTGVATLLNVFSTRLARVADRVDGVAEELRTAGPERVKFLSAQLVYLHRRSIALDVAVVLAAIGGAATCAAVLVLFVGALDAATVATILLALFGIAVICALGAIVAYTIEMLMAGTGLRAEAAETRRAAKQDADETAEPETHSGEARENEPPAGST